MEFQDKVALISGGSSGIGLETGKLLAERGAQVWLLARNRERLQLALAEVEKMCRSPRQHCGTVVADVTDFTQVREAVAEVTEKCDLRALSNYNQLVEEFMELLATISTTTTVVV